MAKIDHSPFTFEVLISGTASMLERVREMTAFAEPGRTGHFSFDRIVPRPLCIEGTANRRAEFAGRFHREILGPWENLIGDFDTELGFHRRRMTELLDSTCTTLWDLGFTSDRPIRDWMEENWGTRANVDPPEDQPLGLTDTWVGNRIHARLYISSSTETPPLPIFDALAQVLPGIKIAVAWSSEAMYVLGEGTGIATWRNGVRTSERASKRFDRGEPFGALQSLRPLRIAKAIRDAGFAETQCLPTLRWTLTAAGLEALRDGESITIPIGPAHEVTIGSDRDADFNASPANEVTAEDIDWNCCVVREDEVWHRLRGSIDGMSVALSLHSPEVVEANRQALTQRAGHATEDDWVRTMWSW